MNRSSVPLPAPGRRAPSITRLFLATFFAVALAGLGIALISWVDATRAERDVLTILQTLDRLQTVNPTLALEVDRNRIREIAENLGDAAQQSALATTIIVGAVLTSLGIGLLYSRRRLDKLLETVRTQSPPPALVLLDIQLPGRDGYALLQDLKALEGDHPWKVVALTAHAMPADRAIAAVFDGYVTKPIDVRAFPGEVAAFHAAEPARPGGSGGSGPTQA